MTTKDYLGQIKKIDCLINNKLDEIYRLRSLVTSITISSDKENIKKSSDQDKLGNAIAKIVDLERETDELIDHFISRRKHIIAQIDAMDNLPFYNVLSLRFVSGLTIEAIAKKTKYSVDSVKRIQRDAIKAFEKIYGAEYL